MLASAGLILRVAFRNLWLYRVKSLVITGLLAMGSLIAIVGLSLLRDVERTMQDSVISSVAGHLQVYSAKAKDDLALFGNTFMGRAEIGSIPDIAPVREVIKAHPNVEDVIPMGSDMAMLGRGNELDETLSGLRQALKEGDQTIVQQRKDELAFQMEQLKRELGERARLSSDQETQDRYQTDLAKAMEPEFLSSLKSLDEDKLLFLDTRIAPISGEKQPVYLMYLGTDIELFEKNFPKFKMIEGEPLAPGQRGILISYKTRETVLKVLVARLFDSLKKRVQSVGVPIKGDPENERLAFNLPKQYNQILSALDRAESEALSQFLNSIGLKGATLKEQVEAFLKVDDQNFAERYQQFYAEIAPKMRLYEISPGETIVLRSYTKSGYVKSLPVKVFGVYSFDGLEDSDLAGVMNILDLVSFRELYGEMNEASKKELEAMRAGSNTLAMDAAAAEAALFGDEAPPAAAAPAAAPATGTAQAVLEAKPTLSDTFAVEEIKSGLALNAAIRLKDGRSIETTRSELGERLKAAGLDMKLVDWREATGIVGQFALMVRLVLIFALLVIFVVALVIINNSIIVATLNRTKEIGTMRAIGAQRGFVLQLFLAETAITALLGSVLGGLLALIILSSLGRAGIPAMNDIVTFLFSGPRLYPRLHWDLILLLPPLISLIATLSSLYAARHAAQVSPAEAMQDKE